MSEERIEYSVELTSDDGSLQADMWPLPIDLAMRRIEWHNTPGNSYATARLMRRTVTTGPWEPVE